MSNFEQPRGLADLFSPQMDKTFGDSSIRPRSAKGPPVASKMEVVKRDTEADLVREQIAQEKVRHSEAVEKLKTSIATREARVEQIEAQNAKYLEDVRERHRKDIGLLEEQHAKMIQQLIDQKIGL